MWVIAAEPNVMMRLKRIFPRLRTNQTGAQTLSDTPEVARDLEWATTRYPLEISEVDREHLARQACEHRETEETVANILSGRRAPLPFGGVVRVVDGEAQRPYPEQLQAAELILATGRLLLGDDVGFGKTLAALLVLRDDKALPAVVVAPTHLTRQWLNELHGWMPWLHGHLVRHTKVYDPARRREMHGHHPDVYIITYTMLHGWVDHLADACNTAIFEEIQELRRLDTRKRDAAIQLARSVDYRAGLSASPVYNYGGEAHNVVSVLDDDVLGDRGEFVREWCAAERADKTAVEDPAGLGRYLQQSGVLVVRHRKKGPPVRIPHLIDADQRELDRLLEGTVDLAEVILSRNADRTAKFIASGDLDLRMRQATGIAKAPYVAAFVQMLLDSQDKVVLWGWHRAVYDLWLERLAAFNPVMYTGTESAVAKTQSVTTFTTPLTRASRGEPDPHASRVLIMSLRSGTGLDGLQKVCNVGVFGELDWSPKIHDQGLGRLDPTRGMRPDIDASEIPAAVGYFLFTDHGSDPTIMDVLNVKRMQAEPITDPDADLFETTPDTTSRVRLLAESVLSKRTRRAA